jgi:O-antigen/teichoic acid export membrane protein
MEKKKFLKSLLYAFFAQGVSYLTSALISLVVPKLLGVEKFGYWQLFLLYASYAGLADLGLSEGIYLIYGGKHRDEIDCRSVSGQFRIYAFVEIVFSILLLAIAYVLDIPNRSFVIACTGVYLLIVNLSSYMYYLLQAINETQRYSMAIIVSKLTFIVALVPLLLLQVKEFEPYLVFYVIAQGTSLVYCIHFCKDLIFEESGDLREELRDAAASIRIGYKLLIANLTSTLVMGIARMMVDSAWGIETFGQLSLAFTLCNFFLQCVYQFSMVLFPALRRLSEEKLGGFYQAAQTVLNALLPFIFVAYFPVALFINFWLPAYDSVTLYFSMMIPVCIFDGRMDILGNTFLKVIRKERLLMEINIITVLIGTAALALAAFVFHDLDFVIWSLVLVITFRCIFTETYISKQLSIITSPSAWTSLVVTLIFLLSTSYSGISVLSITLTSTSVILSLLVNKGSVSKAIDLLRS